MTRLAIFTTHPIQYQAPWFRALAAETGIEVVVVFSYVPDKIEQGKGFGEAFEWDIPLLTGYPYRVLSTITLPGPVPGFGKRWARGINRALDGIRPHVALVLGWQEISLVQALLVCRRRAIPIILRGESNARRPRHGLISLLHRRYFGLCDAFLAIGKANGDFYRLAGVRESQILTAGYFIDNERFSTAAEKLRDRREEIRRAWAIADDAACFAFVGKLEPKKRVMDYLGAVSRARDSGANVAGLIVGSGTQLGEAQRYVEERALPVTFAGFLNQSEISKAYVAADALVLPSDYAETWGLVVNEAMACGKPAIVSDRIGAANDLVVDGRTGVVVPGGNVRALAEAMMRLASDQNARRAMGAAAQAHVRRGYSIAGAVRCLGQAIEVVLAARNAAA